VHRKGFSLVEVLVSLAITALAIGMFSYFGNGITLTRNSQIDTQAQAFARSYFDTMRANWSQSLAYTAGALPSMTLPSGYTSLVPTSTTLTTLSQRGVVLRRVVITFNGPAGRSYRFETLASAPSL
jgi:prepilin-type N-terminal cleavage/methylation domain-containing protein